jgi:hypothetical protein
LTPRHVGVQRLKVLVAVMLARERRALADAEDGGGTELAAALATLPSGSLEMVADAVAALGHADARGTPRCSAGVSDAILTMDLPQQQAASLYGRRSVRSAACCLI